MPTINLGKKVKKITYPKNEFNNDIQKIYNSKPYKRLRLIYIKQNPLCVMCLKIDMIVAGQEIDHIKEISSGKDIDEQIALALDEKNLQTLCKMHHHQKHNLK